MRWQWAQQAPCIHLSSDLLLYEVRQLVNGWHIAVTRVEAHCPASPNVETMGETMETEIMFVKTCK